jgi:hypothetical protein
MPSSAAKISLARAKCCRSGFALTSQPELASIRAMPVEAEVREAMTLFVVARSHDRVSASDLEGNAKDFARGQICETGLRSTSFSAAVYSSQSPLISTREISCMIIFILDIMYMSSDTLFVSHRTAIHDHLPVTVHKPRSVQHSLVGVSLSSRSHFDCQSYTCCSMSL